MPRTLRGRGTQGGCALAEEILPLAEGEELERDIRRLQDKIGAALDCCAELIQRYGYQPGWDMVEDKLNVAIGWAEMPLEPIPEEDEF